MNVSIVLFFFDISNVGKSDEALAEELLEFAECGATLLDVMGDFFDIFEGELTMNEKAVENKIPKSGTPDQKVGGAAFVFIYLYRLTGFHRYRPIKIPRCLPYPKELPTFLYILRSSQGYPHR